MGAYLSEPNLTKESCDDNNERISYGASSMQGWRTSQEDAHNSISDYDTNASLFAVYDGHGGVEVAAYCAKYLPDLIKSLDEYKEGNIEEALKKGFLKFDALLITDEAKKELQELAKNSEEQSEDDLSERLLKRKGEDDGEEEEQEEGEDENGEEDEDDEDDGDNVEKLYDEATMPINEVLVRNYNKTRRSLKKIIKTKRVKMGLKPTKSSDDKTEEDKNDSEDKKEDKEEEEKGNDDVENQNGEKSAVERKKNRKKNLEYKMLQKFAKAIKGMANKKLKKLKEKESTENEVNEEPKASKDKKVEKEEEDAGEEAEEGEDEDDPDFDAENDDEDDDEDNFAVDFEDEDDDEDYEDEEDDDDDEDEDDDEIEEEYEEEEECEEDFLLGPAGKSEPGYDSGCTAVLAVLRDKKLYVANAGDSRCVVCRGGKAIDMSIDHKPEDEDEKQRIVKAGGRVTVDGRVNGGLNLSRALGDHTYKKNKELQLEDQMITSLPDIKVLDIDDSDEFMILACDGIWNSMSSQECVDYVRERLNIYPKLSQIIEELFMHCLAPNSNGDGTGCDNMTCVIVTFKPYKPTNTLTNHSINSLESVETNKDVKINNNTDETNTENNNTKPVKRPHENGNSNPDEQATNGTETAITNGNDTNDSNQAKKLKLNTETDSDKQVVS